MSTQAIRDALAAGPVKWKADKYGQLKDQHGESVRLNGVALPSGHIPASDSSHKNTAFVLACNPSAIAALLKELDAKTEALEAVKHAIYMDDTGGLRLTRSFDEAVIDAALTPSIGEQG